MKMKSLAVLATSGLLAAFIGYTAPAIADDSASSMATEPTASSNSNQTQDSNSNSNVGSTNESSNSNGSSSSSNGTDEGTPDTATGDDDY